MKKKLIDVFDNWMLAGIFSALDSFDVPWQDDNLSLTLNTEYYGNISGSKPVSPLVTKLLETDETEVLHQTRINQLAQVIYDMNIRNWTKEYATLSFDYNPINNYDMTETGSDSTSISQTKNNTGTQGITHTGTQGITHTGTETEQHTGTETNAQTASSETGIYGFNSSTASGADSSSGSGSNTRTDNLTDTRTDNLTDTRTDNLTEARTDNLQESISGTEGLTHSLSRSGNIGVTTSQQMIQSERELYLWNFFYNIVFPSVDKTLTLAIYSN